MQKLWTMICLSGAVAWPLNARTLVDVDQISVCSQIRSAAERLDCYDAAVIDANESAYTNTEPAPDPEPSNAQPAVTTGLANWSQNPNLPDSTRLAAQVLASNERTQIGGFPIAVVDSESHQIMQPPQSPLELFMRKLSDETVAATRYSRDFYFSLPSTNSSSEPAILSFSCQRNITNMHVHFAKQFPEETNEVVYYIAQRPSGALAERTSNERFIDNGYVMEAPRGLAGIDLIKWIESGNELEIATKRNGEKLVVNFNIQNLAQPLSILARQCSWSL